MTADGGELGLSSTIGTLMIMIINSHEESFHTAHDNKYLSHLKQFSYIVPVER
jgi:hypothetical protein